MPVERACQVCGRPFRAWPHEAAAGRPTCSTACREVRKRVPLAVRFWRHVAKTATCWLWTGMKNSSGAGLLAVREGGRVWRVQALRVGWELHHGPIPAGRRVWHRCRRSACVRPDHLYLVRARYAAGASGAGDGAPLPARNARFATGRIERRRTWWTRERVLEGLRRFHRDTGQAPPTSVVWDRLAAAPRGDPRRRPYPSSYAVLRHFPTFRAAWEAAGVPLADRHHAAWTPAEDWYVREAIGRLPTAVIAADLARGPSAVHKRARKLGCHILDAWGWPLTRAAQASRLPRGRLQAYVDAGVLPVLRGAKCVYVDPADLAALREIDWTAVAPELETAARASLRRRLVALLAAGAGAALARS